MKFQPRCVIFDMDGTITHSNQLIYDAFNLLAEKYLHKRLTPEEIVSFFGPPEQEAVITMIGSEHIDQAMKEYYEFYERHHNTLSGLYPGLKEVFEFLRSQKILLGIFTGKGRRTTDISLKILNLAHYFDVVMTGDDVDEFKPSGDGIKKIMAQYSLKPDEVLMVGDSVGDVRASHDAGVRMAAVLWDSYGKEKVLQMETDFQFHDVPGFSEWLVGLYS